MIALIRLVYNAAWIAPIVLVLTGTITFSAGFITFTAVTALRFAANLYLNNALNWQQAELFPFRA